MNISKILLILLFISLAGCGTDKTDKSSDDQLRDEAVALAHKVILIDTHIDVPEMFHEKKMWLRADYHEIPVRNTELEFDYERARKGGLDALFMSIYIPSSYQQLDDKGMALADSLIQMVDEIAASHPDKFALVNGPDDIERNAKEGKISIPMGLENGAPIGDNLDNIKNFFDKGIRYITLTHAKDNQICDSSYDTLNTWNGLSPFGEKVVSEMNRVGVMVDISHVTDSTFFDVIKIAKAPVIASHSSCRYFTPGFQRNMSDDMIRALGKNDGVIQINFGASFLDSLARVNSKVLDSLGKALSAKGLTSRDSAAQSIIAQFTNNPRDLYSDVERVADHIDHVVKLVGIDHVGIGSDFDGVNGELPIGLKDVSAYPNLIFVLLKRGYTPDDIEKICSKNILRVWNKVSEVAAKS